MDWITIALFALPLAFVAWQLKASRLVRSVPEQHRVPADGLQAIEYYWRPG